MHFPARLHTLLRYEHPERGRSERDHMKIPMKFLKRDIGTVSDGSRASKLQNAHRVV